MKAVAFLLLGAISLSACTLTHPLGGLQGASQPTEGLPGDDGTGGWPLEVATSSSSNTTAPTTVGSGGSGVGGGGDGGGSGGEGGSPPPPCDGPHELQLPAGDHCYYFDPTLAVGWNGAVAYCRGRGAGWDLITITYPDFQWSSGEPWSYAPWDYDEPSNYDCGSTDQDCVEMLFEGPTPDGEFHDDCCNEARLFICERP